MTQGEHVVELGPGDYLRWDGLIPHDVEAIGDEPGIDADRPAHPPRRAARLTVHAAQRERPAGSPPAVCFVVDPQVS